MEGPTQRTYVSNRNCPTSRCLHGYRTSQSTGSFHVRVCTQIHFCNCLFFRVNVSAQSGRLKTPRLTIDSIKLHVKYLLPKAEIMSDILRTLSVRNAEYNFFHPKIFGPQRLVNAAVGHRYTIFKGRVPSAILLFFVYSANVVGGYARNPFQVGSLSY